MNPTMEGKNQPQATQDILTQKHPLPSLLLRREPLPPTLPELVMALVTTVLTKVAKLWQVTGLIVCRISRSQRVGSRILLQVALGDKTVV